jgi:hypothetical protein
MQLTATEWKWLSANDKKNQHFNNIGKKDCFISEELWVHYTGTVKPVSWKEIDHISSAREVVAFYASSSEEMFKLWLLSMANIVSITIPESIKMVRHQSLLHHETVHIQLRASEWKVHRASN